LNPRLVFAKGHGQGQRGPDAEAGGFDSVSYWSRGGVGHMLSSPDAASPVGQRAGQGDIPSGMFLAAGVCAALVAVARTGKGVVVDTSLFGAAMWTLAPDLAYTSIAGHEPPRTRADPAARSPLVGVHRTADGRWLQLSMLDEDRYWEPTCRALGLEALIEQFPDGATRSANRERIYDQISSAITAGTHAAVDAALRAEGCIFSFYASPDEVLADEAASANGYAVPHPTHPTLRLSAAPAQFDDELPAIRRPAPTIGEHPREILTELGYTADEITRFGDDGVLATE
jgi:crotonobetainyl-CoA:carnitine CoA-transferase CaiB-like acyl-CoA transferase